MKQFLKYVLATVVGFVIVGLLMGFMSVLMLMGVAMSTSAPTVEKNSVLVVNLEGVMSERSQDNPFAQFMGSSNNSLGLDNLLLAVSHAKENDNVKGIYLEAGNMSGATPAMLQELRDALVDFKESGKFVVSYGDSYTQGTYYLCSVADSVVINPEGMLDWKGVAMQTVFFKDLFEKVGVKMQVFKVGTYKSAVEPFISTEMSEANREQTSVFSSEIWKEMLADVSESRKVEAETLNSLADTTLIFCDAEMYLDEKLVDKLAYSDDVPHLISSMMGVDDVDDYATIGVNDMASVASNKPKDDSGNIVAVYYAYGDIVDEEGSMSVSDEGIVSSKVIRDLEDLADDDDVKAVVLRVNSGGGSAYASEQIWHQVMNIKSKKPIVVSMGGMAASGGYYISCAADWIVAEPTTLTGSIGIFGMVPDASELINETLGVHSQTVKTNKYSDFGELFRPMNSGEQTAMQSYVNRGYELFTKRCADGRGMAQDSIKAVAEGRVWTGLHAKQLGLVDQLGGLDDAIEVAKKKASIEACTIMAYPAKSNLLDQMTAGLNGDSYADAKIKDIFGDYYGVLSLSKRMTNKSSVQAALPYYYLFNM